MPTPGQELSSIDFESMLGGPLVAVVNAQAQSAMATINFIKEVGFKTPSGEQKPDSPETGEPIYVKFKYQKEVSAFQPAVVDENGTETSAAVPADIRDFELEVPMLAITPIPYLRVEETTIDFNAKINSVSYRRTDTNFKVDASLEAKAGWLWGSAKLKVGTSYQRNTRQGHSVNRTYSLAVHVRAVQDELPGGMERVLGLLEDSIRSKPAKLPENDV